MRKALATLMSVAVLAAGGSTLAAQTKAAPEPAKKSAAQPAHVARGTVKKFDAATGTLTVSMAKGAEENFMIGPKATLREGEKTIATSDLASLVGRDATIRYMESEGQKNAESVMVSSRAPAATSGTEKPKPAPARGTEKSNKY
jgi:hypothetical protein